MKQFVYETGQVFRLFRKYTLKKTLVELGGSQASSLSNFETGKLRKLDYIPIYINECKDERQLYELYKLVNQVIFNEWKRGQLNGKTY